MSSQRLQTLALVAPLLLALAGFPGKHSLADDYPSRPVRLIVPTAPGGGTDILARVLAQRLSQDFGQPVVVDNRAGAGSTIGTQIAARATPDGYTVLMVTTSFAINPSLRKKLPYDSLKDLAPVAHVASVQNILLVYPSLPVETVQELAALLRAHPGKYNYASGGYGTSPHLAIELFKNMGKFDIVHVAYKGSGPALTDLMGGRVSLMINGAPPAIPFIKAGKLRALAATGSKRWKEMPALPTISETVLPGYEAVTWFGLLAPGGTPSTIISRINAAVAKALKDPAVSTSLTAQGFEPVGSTPREFAALISRDTEKYKRVVRETGLTLVE